MSQLPDNTYQNILTNLKEKIRLSRYRASLKVNFELLKIYWEIGNTILQQQKLEGWGAKIIDNLALDLKTEFPDFKGLSVRNLKYMRTFAEAYPHFSNVQPVAAQIKDDENTPGEIVQAELAQLIPTASTSFVQGTLAQLSWYHHITLLDKVKDPQIRLFYLQKAVENGWTRDIMVLQIDSNLHQRQGMAITNFSKTLPAVYSDFAAQTLKSPYIIDFLSITEEMKERDIERGLIQHLKNFMLELGRGFAYVGNQKNIVVEGDDFFLDLLFFNYNLNCFVIFELKVGDFKPEYAGKLNFYVTTINEQLRGDVHKPTIGVLLCKTPNKTVIEYSLKEIGTPIGVADYELAKSLPKEFKGEIPSIAELEAEIEKEYEELKSPTQKRFDSLKERLANLKGEEIKQTFTNEIIFELIDKSLMPLYDALLKRLANYNKWFLSQQYLWQGKDTQLNDLSVLQDEWKNEDFIKTNAELYFVFRLNGFIKAGIEAFDVVLQLNFRRDTYWYGFALPNYNNYQPFIKKLYHDQLSQSEIDTIVEIADNFIMDSIEGRLKHLNKLDNI